ncbi:hypothetical protein ACFQX6_61140 [Streptosporangium lutulentum]
MTRSSPLGGEPVGGVRGQVQWCGAVVDDHETVLELPARVEGVAVVLPVGTEVVGGRRDRPGDVAVRRRGSCPHSEEAEHGEQHHGGGLGEGSGCCGRTRSGQAHLVILGRSGSGGMEDVRWGGHPTVPTPPGGAAGSLSAVSVRSPASPSIVY